MNISESNVKKLVITDVPNMDPIAVYLEDLGPGRGKITITCFNDAWSNYWSHMGEDRTISAFFQECNPPYLATKLAPHIEEEIDDTGELERSAKRQVIADRREGNMCKAKARELFDKATYLSDWHQEGGSGYADAMFDIFGEDWWTCCPGKTNPRYEYLCRIIDTVKEALSRTDRGHNHA